MDKIAATFAAIIDTSQAKSILTIENSQRNATLAQLAANWVEENSDVIWSQSDLARSKWQFDFSTIIDLALINNILIDLSKVEGQQLLAQLRNYGTRQIAVMVSDATKWTLNDFICLGFRKHASIEPSSESDQAYELFTYNLDSYNHKRTWNNPRFWANPEMWNKSRW